MLKITGNIILSLLLLFTTTGLSVSKHFCGDELISTTLFAEAESCCDAGGCCSTESETYQLDEDFSVSPAVGMPASPEMDLISFAPVSRAPETMAAESNIALKYAEPPPPEIGTVLSKVQSYLL